MPKAIVIGGAFAAVVVIGGVVLYNASQKSDLDRRQRETDAKIADLQRQLNNRAGAAPATPLVVGVATQSFTQKEALSRQVIEEGFKKLNSRESRQVADAVRIFQEGIEKVDAKNAQFYNGLGRALLVQGKYADALAAFQEGEKLDGTISDIISGQGWVYWNLKDYPAAKEKWEQALKLNPHSIDAWSAMAWIYLGLGQRDKSLEGFNFLIFDSGINRDDWKIGRNLAAGDNTDIAQISRYFPMPPASAFTRPASASAPATTGD